ncbi:MAG: TonB-dependent receptor domain-containing protein [Sphingomonadaceae bacterium]
MKATFRSRLLTSTLIVGAASLAMPAWAQPVDEDEAETPVEVLVDEDAVDDEGTDTIIVTGTRIPRRDLSSTSPLAVVQDEEFLLSGSQNVEATINTLPQVVPSLTAFSNNPGNGTAVINLRGLGSTRNLVLVNGRRYMFFDTAQVVDVNTIPQFLIESVDVVTGGASAVYGSDAIAGVLNFRLRDDLEGVQVGLFNAITERGDGHRWGVDLAVGADIGDRGNVTVYGSYYNRDAILQGARAFSQVALQDGCIVPGSIDPETGAGVPGGAGCVPGPVAGGSLGVPGTSLLFGLEPFEFPFKGPNQFGIFERGPGGASVRRLRDPQDRYNYAPDNFLQLPQERWLIGGYGSYEITDGIEAYTEISFANNRVDQQLAPTPFFDTVSVPIDSPFLDEGAQALLAELDRNDDGVADLYIGRRMREVGPRRSLDDRNAFRALGGVKGDFGGGFLDQWTYDLYYFYARTRNAQVQEGNVSRSAVRQAVLTTTDGEGDVVCQDQSGGCVPLNIFGQGNISPEAADFVRILASNSDISELEVASGSVAGSLGDFGAGPIGIALGVEHRAVFSRFIPDTALSSGDVAGFNAGDPTEGGYHVNEIFGELRIPIIADDFIHLLQLNAAARYSDYSLEAVGGVETYAVGAEFAPVRDITFRGQYQRAVRAPNVGELFSGGGQGFPPASDPCADPVQAANPATRETCIATGVPAGSVGDPTLQLNPQIEGNFGGNPDLEEETSDTYTFGAVIQPRFVPRLAITIDYFDITVDNFITVLGGGVNNVLDLCYNTIQDPSSPFCQAVNRTPAGNVDTVDVLNANIAQFETSGVDLQITYNTALPFGLFSPEASFDFFFLGTWLDELNFTPVVELPDRIDICADQFGETCGTPAPEYGFTTRFSIIDGPSRASLRVRYVDEVQNDQIINANASPSDLADPFFDEQWYFDLSFTHDVNDNLMFALGVNNLFDNKPPLGGDSSQQANTYPSVYDVLGRDFFASATLRF